MTGFGLSLNSEVPALVERARLGDQNAIAMIAQLRKTATTGKAKAVAALKKVETYIKKNPVKEPLSAKIMREFQQLKTALANGPAVSVAAVQVAGASFGAETPQGKEAFTFGYANFLYPGALGEMAMGIGEAAQALRSGAAMAYARALQGLRAGLPISAFSPSIGWELGE